MYLLKRLLSIYLIFNSPYTALDINSYKLVYPILSTASASTYNISIDIIGPSDELSCLLQISTNGLDGWSSSTLTNQQSFRRSVTLLKGYQYNRRLQAIYTPISGNSPPSYIRGDCIAIIPSIPFSTPAIRLYGLSPQILTIGNMTAAAYPNAASSGYPWGVFNIAGLDSSPCSSTTVVSITVGGIDCIPWASAFPSPIGNAVASPHCSTIIGSPTTTLPSKIWTIKCVSGILAGSKLPVIVTLKDTITQATISSSTPDTSPFSIIPYIPSISYVDVFADQVTSISTRATLVGLRAQAFDVPASPSKNSFGRVRVSFASYSPCPKFELRTNNTVLASWNFTKTGGSECGSGALSLISGIAQLSPFPSTGHGNGSSLDVEKRLGHRIVLIDSIETLGGYESYPVESEASGKIMLLTYSPPEAVSVVIHSIDASRGPMGVSVVINVTADQLGPLDGVFSTLPRITIGGKACTNVIRIGPRLVQAIAPIGSGSGLPLVIFVGDNTPSNTLLFSYPKPTIVSADLISSLEWSNAFSTSLAGPTPRLNPPIITSLNGPFLRGVILNVSKAGNGDVFDTGDVVILRGVGFGAWMGTGILSPHPPDQSVWSTYLNNSMQCLFLAWAGRGSSSPTPICNGRWDFAAEGELPIEGIILWWSDSYIAFRAPPSWPGFREVIISVGGGIGSTGVAQTSLSSTSWWDYSVLLRYGTDLRITSAIQEWNAQTNGGSELILTGPAFSTPSATLVDSPSSLLSYTFPMSIPSTLSLLATMPPFSFTMMVFHIGAGSGGVDVCSQPISSVESAFANIGAYLSQTAVPVPSKCIPTNWNPSKILTSITPSIGIGSARISIPAGNGLNISLQGWIYDAYPDRITGNVMKVIRWGLEITPGIFPNGQTIQFSYASPTIFGDTGLVPRSIAIGTSLSTVTTRITLTLTSNGGAEETVGCSIGQGMPSMSLLVSFIPSQSGYENPIGGSYNMIPTTGSILPKTKGAIGSQNCSSILGTFGYPPNLAIGKYGVRITTISSSGNRIGETRTNDGISITCASGYYGKLGTICSRCLTGASCPGGNISFDAVDLNSPIFAPIGFYNYFGTSASLCPANTPIAQRPVGKDVCIAACVPSSSCLAANVCAIGYATVPSGCVKCDVGYSRVNPSNCLPTSSYPTMISLNGTCISPSTCTSASGSVWFGTGINGEDECVCSGGATPPSPSSTPTISNSNTPTPTLSVVSSSIPSSSPLSSFQGSSISSASNSITPTSTNTVTISITPTTSQIYSPGSIPSSTSSSSPSSSSRINSPSQTLSETCDDGIKNSKESDIDCGGQSRECLKCALGQDCLATTDCESSLSFETICSSSSLKCLDTRLSSSFWDSRQNRTSSSTIKSHLVFSTLFNATNIPKDCVSGVGVAHFSQAFTTTITQLLSTDGLGIDKILIVAVPVSLTRLNSHRTSTGTSIRRQLEVFDGRRDFVNISLLLKIVIGPSLKAPMSWRTSSEWSKDVTTSVTRNGLLSISSVLSKLKTLLILETNSTFRTESNKTNTISRIEYAWANVSLSSSSSSLSSFTMLPIVLSSGVLESLISVEAAAAILAASQKSKGPIIDIGIIIAICLIILIVCFIMYLFWKLRTEGVIFGGWKCKSFATVCGFWPLPPDTLIKVKSWRPRKKGPLSTTTRVDSNNIGKSKWSNMKNPLGSV
jgi:hypothetical protein